MVFRIQMKGFEYVSVNERNGGEDMDLKSENFENLTFKTALLGYSRSQVIDTMTKMLENYKKNCTELAELKSHNLVLSETVQHYKTIEEAMQHCLIIAQHMSNEIVSKADEKASKIIDEAEATALKMVNNATLEVNSIQYSYEDVKRKIFSFRLKSEALINAQMEVLKQLSNE
ncbi:MAG: DivIVA domain-containing protein [Clostridia bacterium]|nr:DivIVA domain-containing protein [Clostridia bacterium]